MLNLTGHRLFIAGGSRGIGRAAALMAAQAGADIAVGYVRDRTAADQIVQQITALGRKAIALQADVTNEMAITAALAQAAVTLG
ncbi:MAG: SDR family NAD(P)-dependent oxidoreductase, partial [Opitutaceae bacterium]|nr:SDR family NAD(P)-dependent oxidoreductase [Opitutaceae bacterium]